MKTRLEILLVAVVVGITFFIVKALANYFTRRLRYHFGTPGESQSLLEMSRRNVSRAITKAFVICFHREHGFLVLYAYKAKKGRHGQLSGGGVDEGEEPITAAARELFEETGLRVDLDRLKFFMDIDGKRFFVLELFDSDSCGNLPGFAMPSSGQNFLLKLSKEHVGFCFIKDRLRACEAIQLHSGGTCAIALSAFRLEDHLS